MGQNSRSNEDQRPWRVQYRPYIVAAVLAFVWTMLVVPEVNGVAAMAPVIKDGQVVVATKTSYSAKRGAPELNQIILLEKNAATDVSEDNIIARVAGLPGDTIEIKGGKVFRNDKEYITPGGVAGAAGEMKVKVNKDDVFLLCDNREETIDSRDEKLGPVDMKQIKGNVKFIIWPLSNIGGVH